MCGASSGSAMGSWIPGVDEPRALAHGGTQAQAIILGEDKGLEMVQDDGLERGLQLGQGGGVQEQAQSSQASRKTRDGGWAAAEGACDLAVGATGDETGSDWSEELGTLEVVARSEALSGDGPAAGQAAEAWNPAEGIAASAVGAAAHGAIAAARPMVRAVWPGAVWGSEAVRTTALDRPAGGEHGSGAMAIPVPGPDPRLTSVPLDLCPHPYVHCLHAATSSAPRCTRPS